MNLSNENLDKYSSLTDIENKVEELKTNKNEKTALFRPFNNNSRTEDADKKSPSKDKKKALRFKLFNKSQEPEGDLIKPKTEIHLDSQNNAENN